MLAKANRLTREGDFKKLAGKGKPFYSPLMAVKVMKNNLEASRFGIIISTKVSKKATARNQLKRRIAEIVRLNLNQLKKGFDVIVLTKSVLIGKNYGEIESELLKLFKQAGLL